MKDTAHSGGRSALVYAALSLVALLALFPLYWLAVTAFKTQPQIFATPTQLFP